MDAARRNPRPPLGRQLLEEIGCRLPTLANSLSFTPEPRLTIAKETDHVRSAGFHWQYPGRRFAAATRTADRSGSSEDEPGNSGGPSDAPFRFESQRFEARRSRVPARRTPA